MFKHPNIVEYYDSFLEDKALMIVMEYAEGRRQLPACISLHGLINRPEIPFLSFYQFTAFCRLVIALTGKQALFAEVVIGSGNKSEALVTGMHPLHMSTLIII